METHWGDALFGESPPASSKRRLGEFLVAKGLISDTELGQALAVQEEQGGRLGEILVAEGWISLSQLTEAVSEQHGLGQEETDSLRARLVGRRTSAA